MHAALTSVVSAIPLPTVIIGVHERIVNVNDAATSLFGENLVGRHHVMAFRHPQLLDAIESCFDTQEPCVAEFSLSHSSRDLTIRASINPIEFNDFDGLVVCFEDLSHIMDAGQIRKDFVANVSHELRTPLTAMLGFIETIRGPARKDPEAQDRFLGMLEKEARRMTGLVQDLLSLSRVEADERVRPSTKTDAYGVLRATVERVSGLAEKADVEIEFDHKNKTLVLSGDEDQLGQIFTNLIENAIKYGGPKGKVTIDVQTRDFEPALRGPAVIINISDTGPGIPKVHLPRLTERFYRIDSHRSREMGGTGLGLAIVKHIVNRHRGRLRITSEMGQGSCFSVILPLK